VEIPLKIPWFFGETIQFIELESLFLMAWFSQFMGTPRFQTAAVNYASLFFVDCRLASECAGGLAGRGAVSPAPTFGSAFRRLGLLANVGMDTALKLPNGNFYKRVPLGATRGEQQAINGRFIGFWFWMVFPDRRQS